MELWGWFSDNAFNLISAVSVVGSLLFTAFSLRSETKTRRVANLLAITSNHREVWKLFLTNKNLARVRNPDVDTETLPVTDSELVFVNLVIQHLSSVYRALDDHLLI